MQPAKLSKILLITVLLIWGCCCAYPVEAQQFSSRINSSQYRAKSAARRVTQGVGSKASQPIRIDPNPGRPWRISFNVQEDDVDSSQPKQIDSAMESKKSAEMSLGDTNEFQERSSQSESNQLDLDNDSEDLDELDPDELDPDELDPDYEPDPRPQRPMFGAWPRKGIRGISIDIRETNSNAPEDVSQQLLDSNRSDWTQFHPHHKVFAWAAPDIRYQPLYFEDVALERYGQTAGPHLQCYISAVNFFVDFVLLPHQFRHDCPGSCDHPLGFCRPGNTTPYTIQRHYFGRPGR